MSRPSWTHLSIYIIYLPGWYLSKLLCTLHLWGRPSLIQRLESKGNLGKGRSWVHEDWNWPLTESIYWYRSSPLSRGICQLTLTVDIPQLVMGIHMLFFWCGWSLTLLSNCSFTNISVRTFLMILQHLYDRVTCMLCQSQYCINEDHTTCNFVVIRHSDVGRNNRQLLWKQHLSALIYSRLSILPFRCKTCWL